MCVWVCMFRARLKRSCWWWYLLSGFTTVSPAPYKYDDDVSYTTEWALRMNVLFICTHFSAQWIKCVLQTGHFRCFTSTVPTQPRQVKVSVSLTIYSIQLSYSNSKQRSWICWHLQPKGFLIFLCVNQDNRRQEEPVFFCYFYFFFFLTFQKTNTQTTTTTTKQQLW